MKVIIAGSRGVTGMRHLSAALCEANFHITEVISGGAKGADALGEFWAKANYKILTVIPADWDLHGKAAGIVRNAEMAKVGDALIALWDGESRGTYHMIETMKRLGKPVYVHLIKQEPRRESLSGDVRFNPDEIMKRLNPNDPYERQ